MKVIVAGWSKTGTKSMNQALMHLGYNVYDFCENTFLLCDEYIKIVNEGWTTDDFKRMYESVDAVTDFPAWFFWKEIHNAFPDAKIILTVRDNEDVWVDSFMNQIKMRDSSLMYKLNLIFSPTYRKTRRFTNALSWIALGMKPGSPFDYNTKMNASMLKRMYRAHNAYVMQTAPKDKLLVFNCKEGWGPLCEFLEVSIPNIPFPKMNVAGNIRKQMAFPLLEKVRKETKISLAILTVTSVTLSAILYYVGPRRIYEVSLGRLFSKLMAE